MVRNWDCMAKQRAAVAPTIHNCSVTFSNEINPFPGMDKACQ